MQQTLLSTSLNLLHCKVVCHYSSCSKIMVEGIMEALGYVVATLPFFTRQQEGTSVGQTLLYNPSKKKF